MRRRNPIARRNAKRKAEAFTRCYHSKERVLFTMATACIACVAAGGEIRRPSENAHIENDGMGRKSHYTKIVALCRPHHREGKKSLDTGEGREAFELRYKLNLDLESELLERRWLRSQGIAS